MICCSLKSPRSIDFGRWLRFLPLQGFCWRRWTIVAIWLFVSWLHEYCIRSEGVVFTRLCSWVASPCHTPVWQTWKNLVFTQFRFVVRQEFGLFSHLHSIRFTEFNWHLQTSVLDKPINIEQQSGSATPNSVTSNSIYKMRWTHLIALQTWTMYFACTCEHSTSN